MVLPAEWLRAATELPPQVDWCGLVQAEVEGVGFRLSLCFRKPVCRIELGQNARPALPFGLGSGVFSCAGGVLVGVASANVGARAGAGFVGFAPAPQQLAQEPGLGCGGAGWRGCRRWPRNRGWTGSGVTIGVGWGGAGTTATTGFGAGGCPKVTVCEGGAGLLRHSLRPGYSIGNANWSCWKSDGHWRRRMIISHPRNIDSTLPDPGQR